VKRPEAAIKTDPVLTLNWVNLAPGTVAAPSPDLEIDVLEARDFTVQVDTTAAAHTSTSTRISIFSTLDAITWDTIPYQTREFGDNVIRSDWLIELGVSKLRFRAENLAGATNAEVTVKVLIRR